MSEAATVPVTWEESDLNWKLELPGLGHSSPVAWGNRIFLLSADERTGDRFVLAVDAARGELLWQQTFPAKLHRKHRKNSFATSTPAADDQRVYVAWEDGDRVTMLALRHEDGATAWEQDLGPFEGGHGFGASPIVYEDLVVIANDQDGDSSLLALDRKTGQLRWQTERISKRTSYSTPCVYAPPGESPRLIFTDWNHGITAIDPEDGRLVWEKSVFGGTVKRAIGSPIVAGDLVIGTCGFTTGVKFVVALRPQASQPSTGAAQPVEVETVYHLDRGVPHIPSVIAYNDLLFLWADAGIVTCCNLADGKTVWQRRVGGNFMASPICVAAKLYNISEDGEVVVLAASREFAELGNIPLGEVSQSTPAVVQGALILRTQHHLFSVGGK